MQNPHTSDDDADDSIAEGQRNKELFGYTVGGRITVTTLAGSITDERVDVIVNTTGSQLNLSVGFVSPAILKAAGPSIQVEIKKRASTLEPGNIIETGAGKLPVGRIFHVVVKSWDGPNGTSLESLSQVIRKCLDAAHAANQDSIAFPAIGAGILGHPPETCAQVMHEEVLLFFRRHPSSSVHNVHFVLHPLDGAVIEAFTAKRQDLVSGNGETGLVGLLMLGTKKAPLGDIDKVTGQPNKESFGYTVAGRITVTTLEGSITDERVDVIVNVTRSDLDLSDGGVSAAISEAAGTSIPLLSTLEPGDVIATDAGNLPAGSIIHGVVKDGSNGTILASLSEVMRKCLDAVHAANKDSIAFPAIGAGGLQHPPETCARVMHEEVLLFLRRHPRSSVDNVRFVLNPSDNTVIEAFTAKHQEIVSGKGNTAGAESDETITEPIQGTMAVPPYWKTKDQKSRIPQLIPVEPSDEDYIRIKEKLVASGVTKTIKSITRIENMSMYQEYAVCKARIQMDCPEGTKVERMLFHGTNADVINDINTNGFSRSYSNVALYGKGVYFAVNPAYSAQKEYSPPDGNKVKHIYQCLVLTGVFCEGERGLRAPPQIPSLPDGVRYDSVVDKDEPTMFVIFRDNQVYPEYLIQLLDTEVERKLLDTKVQPKSLDTKVQPKLPDTKVQPQLLDTEVQPKLLDTKKVEHERKMHEAYGIPYENLR